MPPDTFYTSDVDEDEIDFWMPAGRGDSGSRKIHPNRDCDRLNRAVSIRPAADVDVDKREVCSLCTGDYDRPTEQDNSYQRSLIAAAAERATATDGGASKPSVDTLDEEVPEHVVHSPTTGTIHRPANHEELILPACNCNPTAEWRLTNRPPVITIHQEPDRLCGHPSCFGGLSGP